MVNDTKEYKKRKWSERYQSSLKQLKPVRTKSKEPSHMMPGPARGFLSLYSLHWMTDLMWRACRNRLTPEHIWTLQPEDRCMKNADRLERMWHRELEQKGEKRASLTLTLIRAFRTRIFFTTLLLVVSNTLALIGPSILLREMILYLNDQSAPWSWAITLLVLMILVRFVSIYFMAGAFGITAVFSAGRATGALQVMLFQKVLRLASASDQILGKVVNICINDMTRLSEALRIAAFVISAFLMTAYGLVMNLVYVGPWSLCGFVVVFASFFFLGSIGGMISVKRQGVVIFTDRRVTFTSEILEAIRLIKMYAWEDSFKEKVDEIRHEETSILRMQALLNSMSQVVTPAIPVVATAVSILGYVISGNELRSAEAFTMFSIFNSLQMAIGTLPYGIRCITESHVSLRRIQRLLLMKDMEVVVGKCEDQTNSIEISSATLAWERPVNKKSKTQRKREAAWAASQVSSGPPPPAQQQDSLLSRARAFSQRRRAADTTSGLDAEARTETEVVLTGLNLRVRAGALLGVAGAVGSGKSSLLVGITGQLSVLSGAVRCAGRVALVPQRAWIFSGTLRDNILFGKPLLPELYQRTLQVCALMTDLALMPAGDLTQIGERGVNLSGGQKQRVNLARAVYSDADVFLLDDPLSAVDSQVGQHIFQECIQGALRDKTVVLVSHGVQYLSRCDEVLYMSEGRVEERGVHSDLMALRGGYYSLVSCDAAAQQNEPAPTQQRSSNNTAEESSGEGGQLSKEEKFISTMSIFKNFAIYFKYLGVWRVLTVALMTLTFATLRTGGGLYLKYWIEAGDGQRSLRLQNVTNYNASYAPEDLAGLINDHPLLNTYIAGYGALVVALLVIGIIKGVCHATCAIRGCRLIHERVLSSLMRCRISFFDTTPVGRILNRLSRDMDCVDTLIPEFCEFLSQRVMIVLVQVMVPVVDFPFYGAVVAIVFALYALLWRCLVTGIRNLKHIENVMRSPLLNHLTSTVGGLSVIRAYNKQDMVINKFESLLDRHTSSNLTFRLANSWFCLRADELGLFLLGAIGATLLLLPGAEPAAAGLILSLVYDTILIMPFMVMLCSELASLMSSVERCHEYTEDMDWEPTAESDQLPPEWPAKGHLRLESLQLRYRPDLPPALRDVNLDVKAGHKVGIVGRTGAGKSTLVSALLRLTELEHGRVVIDGVDVADVALPDLRSRIAVIPQDPVLFSGTVRENLDPFSAYEDARVWHVLERSGLSGKVARLPKQLATAVTSDGDSFSVGERQLVCLARAMLRRSRILLLDEATASVDVQTDQLVQQTIQQEFADCTVLTVAHRLNTVLGCDRVVVMDAGTVAEVGSPRELASNPTSQFRRMLEQAGISSLTPPSSPHQLPPLAEQETLSDTEGTPGAGRVTFGAGWDARAIVPDAALAQAGPADSFESEDSDDGVRLIQDERSHQVEITRL